MSAPTIVVRELVAWPLDHHAHRPDDIDPRRLEQAERTLANRNPYRLSDALLPREAIRGHAELLTRPDLLEEMTGLIWSLGVVDLTKLLAFQRRLHLHPTHTIHPDPFASPKPLVYTVLTDGQIESPDPNLHLRTLGTEVKLHAGSPFFEAAVYRNRWFLRDGYHRAYALLRAGITHSPAVIVHARTLEELGANQPWFFPEDILFSDHPPHLTDFLDDTINIVYPRPQPIYTLRVTIEAGETL